MDFLELAKSRFSARTYQNIPVEEDKLNFILEAARVAPTAVNFQPFRVYVVEKSETRSKINETYKRDWLSQAPLVLVFCSDINESWKHSINKKDHGDIDTAIVIDHVTLAATSVGLATCWVCNFDMDACAKVLNLPSSIKPVAILPLGYSSERPDTKRHNIKRKKIQEIVFKV